ncbi:hypothetical protein BB561_000984 [Smittium simulii]|uniref:Ysc84 actin-binding domain-containing protein n=1 Tax=Smittium simulii TaxID=133385 RepID=A0A2T9YWS5_9FUNG|nr:hypothetical protein BB561_000984 [Smittium simulii]
MGLHSPLSKGLENDIEKASKILSSFLYDKEAQYTDKIIPGDILERCKGIAVLTVIKGGILWSGRAGTGLVISRLPGGEWSAPSAIATAGVGFGGQIGAQITDFVMILNTESAVKAFSRGGNITLGANIGVAAGPVGRNAEIGGSIREAAAIYSYSKSKGLFAGISLEGSGIIERKDANEKFYGSKVSADELLSGKIERPQQAQILYDSIKNRTDYYKKSITGSLNLNTDNPKNISEQKENSSDQEKITPEKSENISFKEIIAAEQPSQSLEQNNISQYQKQPEAKAE